MPPETVERRREHDRERKGSKFGARARVVPISKRALVEESKKYPQQPGVDYARPSQFARSDCKDGHRPCPLVSCRHHLFLEVLPSGSIKYNFPGVEPEDLEHSCSLDVADAEKLSYEEIAAAVNLTRMGFSLVESEALAKLYREHGDFLRLLFAEFGGEVTERRRLPIVRDP